MPVGLTNIEPSANTRRALAIITLGGLLIASVIVVRSHFPTAPAAPRSTNAVFENARGGNCLNWPMKALDRARFVQCNTSHVFEVAGSVDTRNSQGECQQAVRRYLGTRYDPGGKFTITVLSSGAPNSQLCGLQLHGPDGEPIAFKGKVAELDQSRVWPAGTCLGIDSASDQSTGIPVDCSTPHAEEITGVVNLGEEWHGAPPSQHDQDEYLEDACTQATDAYLSPADLGTTGLTLAYRTVSPQSWSAGSRQVVCRIGATLALTGSAKDRVRVSGATTMQTVSDGRQEAAEQPPSATPTTTSTPAAPTPVAGPPQADPSVTASPSPTPEAEAAAAPAIEIPDVPPIALPALAPPAPPGT